ncbi:hypothetical protein J2X98_002197 [Pseudarthrobacter enclensis]|uniref:Uncharacterized protein n=1 Tax=Pseudarthrobacter enclensis TaxID=993070 RepID=A0ABT9RTN2_9MICC|nr:hypothetical protein [Pseudarthrobacter enclensis]
MTSRAPSTSRQWVSPAIAGGPQVLAMLRPEQM